MLVVVGVVVVVQSRRVYIIDGGHLKGLAERREGWLVFVILVL